jgi:hypothetical protein
MQSTVQELQRRIYKVFSRRGRADPALATGEVL